MVERKFSDEKMEGGLLDSWTLRIPFQLHVPLYIMLVLTFCCSARLVSPLPVISVQLPSADLHQKRLSHDGE
jgi:hypothetical protein